jgi:hypothetical protein
MSFSYRYFIVYKVNILPVIPDQSQDIPEIIDITGKERQFKGDLEIMLETECLAGGEVEGGPFVLYYFMAEKA